MKAEERIRRYFHGFSDEQWEEKKGQFPYSVIPVIVKEHAESQLQALKEEVEERQVDNSDHDQGVQGWNSAIREVLNLITNLEDNV